jgi:Ca2+-dependent lipid-binding protein
VGADFSVEIFDWNQIEQAKSLGTALIELADVEPFTAHERTLALVSDKHGDKGEVRIRLMFQPEIIAKSRKNTSTFSSAGRAMTQIGGLPIGAGKGVFHGVTGVFKKVHGDKDVEIDAVPNTLPAGQASQPVGNSPEVGHPVAALSASEPTEGGSHEMGTLKVTVMNAKGLSANDYKPYVILRVGDKEFKTKHVGKTASPEW